MVEVTQADHDAAQEYMRLFPDLRLPEAFARHRTCATRQDELREALAHEERKAVLQNKRVNDAIQTALERGELTVTGNGYLAALSDSSTREESGADTNAGDALREAGWSYVAALPMWSVAVVTDGERVAIAQKAEADFDGYYWAIEPEDALDWEPTHCIALPAALSASPEGEG
jgi:hypothetical protein